MLNPHYKIRFLFQFLVIIHPIHTTVLEMQTIKNSGLEEFYHKLFEKVQPENTNFRAPFGNRENN